MAADTIPRITARVPEPGELEVADQYQSGASEHAEVIAGALDAVVREGVEVEFDAERAWALTLYARNLKMDADELAAYAEAIEKHVDTIWHDLRERDRDAG